jgi:protocatechuate 3,4-dioxygenase beta subunit
VPQVLAVLGLLALLGVPSAAQTRDAGTTRATGAISGIVVSDDAEARPVRKARVTCTGSGDGRTTITDEAGHFVFSNLGPGHYTIGASKPTWVTSAYGARRPGLGGTPVPLAGGQALQLVVRMARGAVITGVLLDHDNQPAAGAQVQALHYRIADGERRLVGAGSATTDDRGGYRIFGLPAGDYYVSATMRDLGGMSAGDLVLTSDADVREAAAAADAAHRRAPEPARTVALAPAFYPSGTSVTQAGVVSLRAGEERSGIDFAMQLVRTARVEGTVTLPEGGVPPGAEIYLIASTGAVQTAPWQPADRRKGSSPGADGTFSFNGIPPGTYTLLARGSRAMTTPDGSTAAAQMVWASTQIAVDGEPVTGLSLSFETGLTIAGRVRFRPAGLKPPALTSIRINAAADSQDAVSFAAAAAVGADGTFTMTGVMPGRYRLSATFPGVGRPGNWTLESIAANGGDALDAPLTITPRQHVLDTLVTFTDHLAQISGVLRAPASAAGDATIVLFPEDQSAWLPQSRRIQATRAAADGAYAFRNVPVGRYFVAVAEDAEPGEWFDPAFLQRLLPAAVHVAVAASETITLDLRRN